MEDEDLDRNAATMTVPLEAPLRQANGCNRRRFERTIVEAETDEGITEPGEMGVVDGMLTAKVAAYLPERSGGYVSL
jgi:L-alanine-DL-glutamate epimerase-like enolase superfamily enzyme